MTAFNANNLTHKQTVNVPCPRCGHPSMWAYRDIESTWWLLCNGRNGCMFCEPAAEVLADPQPHYERKAPPRPRQTGPATEPLPVWQYVPAPVPAPVVIEDAPAAEPTRQPVATQPSLFAA